MFISKKAVTYIVTCMFLIPSIILFNTGFIEVSDSNSYEIKKSDTALTALAAVPNQPSAEDPEDGKTFYNVDDEVALSVLVHDGDGDTLNVTFYNASDDSQIDVTQPNVPSDSRATVTWTGLVVGDYSWYATAHDGQNTTTSINWSFSISDQPPTADFTYSPDSPTTDDIIHFTDTSTDPDDEIKSWSWNFGDETTSTERHPTHQYALPDNYSVNLTITYDYGTNITIRSIVVKQKPTATFTYALGSTPGTDLKIDFTGSASGGLLPYTWHWDFGDEQTSTEQNPSHTYQTSGTFTIELTVTDDNGLSDSFSQTLKIVNQIPTVESSSPSGSSVDVGANIVIDFNIPMNTASVQSVFSITPSVSGLSWSWDANNEVATISHNSFSYSTSYTYTIATTAHDDSIFSNNLGSEYTHSFSTGVQPGCVKLYIKDSNDNKLNPKVYVGDSLKGTASNGYLEVCMTAGTHTFSFELTDYPKITKSITITSGGSQSVDIVMSKIDFDSTQASMGIEFDLSEHSVPLTGQFSIPISITPVKKFNPGETYQISVGYTNKEFSISGEVPSIISQFIDVVDVSKAISYITNGLAEMKGNKITGKVIDTPIGTDSLKIYQKNIDLSVLANFGFWLWLNTKGDIKGQIINEGPVSVANDTVYFTENKFSITIDNDAKPGEEVRIGIIPSYDVAFKLTGRAELYVIGIVDYDSGEKQFYPTTGMTSPINIPSSVTIGFIGKINTPPTANFSFIDSAYTTLSEISFTDDSNDTDGAIAKWSWDFGDGQTSASQNPTHKYETPGTYNVTLTLTDDSGVTNSINKTITIEAAPVELTSHTLDETVSGEIILSGTTIKSGNLNGPITKVEIKIGDSGTWETVEGTTNWKYTLDTTKLENGENTIHVRCTDGDTFSDALSFNLQVDNKATAETSDGIFSGGFDNLILIVLIIAIAAVAAVLLFLYIRKSKSKKEKVVKQKIKKEKETPAFTDPKPALNLKSVKPKIDKKFIAGIDLSNVATADSDTDLKTIGDLSENPDEQIVKNIDDLQEKKVAEKPSVEQKRDPTLNFCAECGAPIGEASNFCIRCGHKMR